MTSVLEALKSAQFVVDTNGHRIAVQLSPTIWQALLTWLETVENTPTVEELIAVSTTDGLLEVNHTPIGRRTTTDSDAAVVRAATQLSESSLAKVWDNSEDDIYNDL